MRKAIDRTRPVLPTIIIVTALFLVVFAPPRLIRINEISCEDQYGPCSAEISTVFANLKGKSLASVKNAYEEYFKARSDVSDYRLRLALPSKLKINFITDKPKYALVYRDSQYALINEDGVVIGYSEETLLPKLSLDHTPPAVGEKVEQKIIFASRILLYSNIVFGVENGDIKDDMLTFRLSGSRNAVFPLVGDEKVLFGGLMLINNELNKNADKSKMESGGGVGVCENGCTIDLRYDNPIIKNS